MSKCNKERSSATVMSRSVDDRADVAQCQSITYDVVPRLLSLVSDQSCTSYRPGVPLVRRGPSRPRLIGRMLKVSKLAAIIGHMKDSKRTQAN